MALINPTDAPVVELSVDTIAVLRTLPGGIYKHILVDGSITAGDGGGGIYRWNSVDVSADNGTTVIAPSVGTGRWNLFETSANMVFIQAGAGALAGTVQSKARESISLFDYLTTSQKADWTAIGFATSAATITAAIQALHTACIAAGYATALFPAGGGNYTTLTWSPHLPARALGRVILQTQNAAGRTNQISDLYGLPAVGGQTWTGGPVFQGPFTFTNSNVGNTAIGWSFGGASLSANFCNECTILDGVNTNAFNGGEYEIRSNAYGLKWKDCVNLFGTGPTFLVADPVENSGENMVADHCTFGGFTNLGYCFDINTVRGMTFTLLSSSIDYKKGIVKPGRSATAVTINIVMGSNLEWNSVAESYLTNDGGMVVNILASDINAAAAAGWPTPVFSKTTNGSVTRVLDARYRLGGTTLPALHTCDATSTLVVDPYPVSVGGNSIVTYATYAAGGKGQAIIPQRDPLTGWALDWTKMLNNGAGAVSEARTPIAAGATIVLPVGAGEIKICDDNTGESAPFWVWAGANIVKLAGGASLVVGAPGANQTGVQWNGTNYTIKNGWGVQHLYYIALEMIRPS